MTVKRTCHGFRRAHRQLIYERSPPSEGSSGGQELVACARLSDGIENLSYMPRLGKKMRWPFQSLSRVPYCVWTHRLRVRPGRLMCVAPLSSFISSNTARG